MNEGQGTRSRFMAMANQPQLHYGAFALMVGIVLWLWGQSLGALMVSGDADSSERFYDFRNILFSAESVQQGGDPYELTSPMPFHRCPYPLFLPFLAIPFTWMPFLLSANLWFLLNLAALAFSFSLAFSVWNENRNRFHSLHWIVPFTIIVLCLLTPIQSNFRNGQNNALVLALAWCAIALDRKDQWLGASLSLAAAIAIKWLPVPLLFYFLIRRRYKLVSIHPRCSGSHRLTASPPPFPIAIPYGLHGIGEFRFRFF